jgi:hypothetical protein
MWWTIWIERNDLNSNYSRWDENKSLSNDLARILDHDRITWERALKLWERCTFKKNLITLTCHGAHTTIFSNIID